MPRQSRKWKVLAVIGTFAVTVLAADFVVPSGVQSIDVREKRGTMWPVVGTLLPNQRADVVRDDGDWLIVRVNGKEGTVKKTAFERPRGDLVKESTGAQASAAEASAAARGIGPEARAYADEKKLSTAPLVQLIDNRKRVEGTKWVGFASSRSVGPYKK